ncbi:MAG TPA: maleylpyruvate isomerase family mycothiol-dependent enzyme [Acidimicrobiales bacterium]|nr:maleylpyruvate isomerase family mycothiol-dependent enzyme [Acidimicrobiales bacterium]
MDDVYAALTAQHAELDGVLAGITDADWSAPTPACPGWTVADVVLHMAQTDEAAAAAAQGQFSRFVSHAAEQRGEVDNAADAAVERDRGTPPADLYARWQTAALDSRNALIACDPSERVNWVAGEMAARTLTTTRLSECWIHTGDVVEALGRARQASDRMWHIARLAWRTIPYAFEREGAAAPGPVAVALDAPDGSTWSFGADDAPTCISGPALDFCLVAARRREPPDTALTADGPDAAAVLALVRTYA